MEMIVLDKKTAPKGGFESIRLIPRRIGANISFW